MRQIAISSSISNFETKLLKRYSDYRSWSISGMFQPTIFFGLYHIGDYLKITLHRGKKTIFFCGADILNLQKSLWRFIIPHISAHFICENEREQQVLAKLRIKAKIHPMIFTDPDKFPVSYKPSLFPQIYLSTHKGREKEYGLYGLGVLAMEMPDFTFHIYGGVIEGPLAPNIIYHGQVSERQFNEEIKGYHGSIRFNEFDGFAEITAKSILMGQYPITVIPYPLIDEAISLEVMKGKLLKIQQRVRSNPNRDIWYKHLIQRVEAQ